MGCGCDSSRFARHEAIAAALADTIKPEGPFTIDLRRRLASTARGRTKIDLNLTCYAFVPTTVSLDITVSCPLTPSYVKEAAMSSEAIFETRDKEKKKRHEKGLKEIGREYHTFCTTTLGGIGPPSAVAYFDHVFRRSAAREAAAGHPPLAAFRRRDHFYATIQAASIRGTANLVCRHAAAVPENVEASPRSVELAKLAARHTALARDSAAPGQAPRHPTKLAALARAAEAVIAAAHASRTGADPIPVAAVDAEPSEPNSSLPAAASDTADTACATDSSEGSDAADHQDPASP